MPELHFAVRWPDGRTETYYSPSTSLREHIEAPVSYQLPEFLTRIRAAMHHASERVRAKYGYPCSSAAATLARIEHEATSYAAQPSSEVTVLRIGD